MNDVQLYYNLLPYESTYNALTQKKESTSKILEETKSALTTHINVFQQTLSHQFDHWKLALSNPHEPISETPIEVMIYSLLYCRLHVSSPSFTQWFDSIIDELLVIIQDTAQINNTNPVQSQQANHQPQQNLLAELKRHQSIMVEVNHNESSISLHNYSNAPSETSSLLKVNDAIPFLVWFQDFKSEEFNIDTPIINSYSKIPFIQTIFTTFPPMNSNSLPALPESLSQPVDEWGSPEPCSVLQINSWKINHFKDYKAYCLDIFKCIGFDNQHLNQFNSVDMLESAMNNYVETLKKTREKYFETHWETLLQYYQEKASDNGLESRIFFAKPPNSKAQPTIIDDSPPKPSPLKRAELMRDYANQCPDEIKYFIQTFLG